MKVHAAGVPRSTAAGWLRRNLQLVVTVAVVDMAEADLRAEVVKLRRRVRTLSAALGLLVAVLRVSDRRAPRIDPGDRTAQTTLLRAADRARKVLPASAVLEILGISSSRYTAWVRAEKGCELNDRAACPRSMPTQLTPDEVRAKAPDEIRHIDTSAVRLVDGRKVWLHAVIDNFSRWILSWRVFERFEIANAVAILEEAVGNAVSAEERPTVMANGGIDSFSCRRCSCTPQYPRPGFPGKHRRKSHRASPHQLRDQRLQSRPVVSTWPHPRTSPCSSSKHHTPARL